MSALQQLRAATGPDHEAIDALFARFDLKDRAGYASFLEAHARAVPAVEVALLDAEGPPALRPRTPLLVADLAALDLSLPAPTVIEHPSSSAEAWGMAYVLEGSRLGGGMLAREVAPGLPHAYLSDTHLPGEWRSFTRLLDETIEDDDVATAIDGARRVFALYGKAAKVV